MDSTEIQFVAMSILVNQIHPVLLEQLKKNLKGKKLQGTETVDLYLGVKNLGKVLMETSLSIKILSDHTLHKR